MSTGLPSMVYGDGIAKRTQVQFGGYNHNQYAGDGQIYDMKNLTSDSYPVLSTRKERLQRHWAGKTDGLCIHDGNVILARAGRLEYQHPQFAEDAFSVIGDVSEGEKTFTILGDYIIIMPDKKYFNTKSGEYGSLEAKKEDLTVQIQNGQYKGEDAKANTLYAEGANWGEVFRVGDAVEISGFSAAANNKTIIIREIEGDSLRFYENSFSMPEDGREEGGISIARTVPDMDFLCENENRLWGCKGSTIYASKLGDPFNWNVFDGLSTDSFAVDVGSDGDFTGCISYLGYPCFFKEDHIYKVYGDRPANFQVMGSASLGVAKGSGHSLAVAGETLFYLSRIGIVAYTGGIPQSVADAFGDVKYKNAVSGSDGLKYYVSMEDGDNASHFFVYDTRKNIWHREDETKALSFAWDGSRLLWRTEEGVWAYGEQSKEYSMETAGSFESFAEFGDFTDMDPNRKGVSKLQLRMELLEGANVTVKIQFDSDGAWRAVKTLSAEKKRSFYLPIIPRRCDHYRIRIEGKGEWKLYSMVRESYSGSEM